METKLEAKLLLQGKVIVLFCLVHSRGFSNHTRRFSQTIQSRRRTTRWMFLLKDFREAIPGTWHLTETRVAKRDVRKTNTHGGGRSSSAGCTCVCYVLQQKTNKENKAVDEVTAEITESAWHFPVSSLSLAIAGVCSIFHHRSSHTTGYFCKYRTCLIFTIRNQGDSNPIGNIKIMSVKPSHRWTVRSSLELGTPLQLSGGVNRTQNRPNYPLVWGQHKTTT